MNQVFRSLVERAVYGFLRWFESFNSVWQTTLLCIAIGVFEIGWPHADPHLFGVLILSLYATFTQNGLAHENQLTGKKVDAALASLVGFAETDASRTKLVQAAVDAILVAVRALETDIDRIDEALDDVLEDVNEHAADHTEQLKPSLEAFGEAVHEMRLDADQIGELLEERVKDA